MEEKVMSIIFDVCNDKVIYKNRDINLFETGLLDSMGFIELLVALEEEFGIEIEPREISKEEMCSPNRLVLFVRRKTSD